MPVYSSVLIRVRVAVTLASPKSSGRTDAARATGDDNTTGPATTKSNGSGSTHHRRRLARPTRMGGLPSTRSGTVPVAVCEMPHSRHGNEHQPVVGVRHDDPRDTNRDTNGRRILRFQAGTVVHAEGEVAGGWLLRRVADSF
jgi:hypothetical protein